MVWNLEKIDYFDFTVFIPLSVAEDFSRAY